MWLTREWSFSSSSSSFCLFSYSLCLVCYVNWLLPLLLHWNSNCYLLFVFNKRAFNDQTCRFIWYFFFIYFYLFPFKTHTNIENNFFFRMHIIKCFLHHFLYFYHHFFFLSFIYLYVYYDAHNKFKSHTCNNSKFTRSFFYKLLRKAF